MRTAEASARQPWGLPLRDRLLIALVASAIIAGKAYLRMPIHVPGHYGVIWMALLVVGTGLVNRRGAATLIALLTAVLAVFFAPGREGVFVAVKYFMPGVVVEGLTPLLGARLDRLPTAVVVGAAAHASKLASQYLIGLLLGIPGGYLALGLGIASTTHVVFGAIGGLLGGLALRRLLQAGIPGMPAPSTDGGGA